MWFRLCKRLANKLKMNNNTQNRSIPNPLPSPIPREESLPKILFFSLNATLLHLTPDNIALTMPDGTTIPPKEGNLPDAKVRLHTLRVARRIFLGGHLGMVKAYIEGEWDSDDLVATISAGIGHEAKIQQTLEGIWPVRTLSRTRHVLRPNSRFGSRKNIASHYDLGNEFYQLWLDDSMTYSSALFRHPAEKLEDAQESKYRRLADQLGLKPGMKILEIGCGWGGFSEIAASGYGCDVTAVTVSREQEKYAQNRMLRAGLQDKVKIKFQDYRDIAGKFDRIVSIEMIEAVGEKFWPAYFGTLKERLAREGRIGLQAITIANERFDRYRKAADFIQAYIFPGGMLPSPRAIETQATAQKLQIDNIYSFGNSYANTLARWRERFEMAWPDIQKLGMDERFRRLWRYYLAYSEAGFRRGTINVSQYILSPQKN
jgi:cyclopropane-fatty-acyl-phospholipid synthase